MNTVHLIISDLLLPQEYLQGLQLPCLTKLLARARSVQHESVSLEHWLFNVLGHAHAEHVPVAAISAAFDGLPEHAHWLRADPVFLQLNRDKLILQQNHDIQANEAEAICASLNQHFAEQGMQFFAPHPQRWYVKLNDMPALQTIPLSQVLGKNVHQYLPKGDNALLWHQFFNEIQMLLFEHPVNQQREQLGKLLINSIWLWGNGAKPVLQHPYAAMSADDVLAQMLAQAAQLPFTSWQGSWQVASGAQLLFYNGLRQRLQGGDIDAWRDAVQQLEQNYVQPLWQALRAGKLKQLRVDVCGADGIRQMQLSRADSWAFWRRG